MVEGGKPSFKMTRPQQKKNTHKGTKGGCQNLSTTILKEVRLVVTGQLGGSKGGERGVVERSMLGDAQEVARGKVRSVRRTSSKGGILGRLDEKGCRVVGGGG